MKTSIVFFVILSVTVVTQVAQLQGVPFPSRLKAILQLYKQQIEAEDLYHHNQREQAKAEDLYRHDQREQAKAEDLYLLYQREQAKAEDRYRPNPSPLDHELAWSSQGKFG